MLVRHSGKRRAVNRPQGLGFEPATTSSSAAAAPLVPLRSGTPARVFSAEGVRRSGEPLIGGNAAKLRRFCVRQLRSKWSRRERDADTQQHRSRTHTRRQNRTPGTRALVGDRTGHRQQDRKVVGPAAAPAVDARALGDAGPTAHAPRLMSGRSKGSQRGLISSHWSNLHLF
ncbi:Hypothetical protein SMAX5B_002639 [Scophthalmus maximus]|uniref:Uncharacterized protein n=1 Tax=Scophthalmus maximus TaxID=52904 RepID=A0A2U9C0F6_SCOMX|nr:Hypothetical protein SMAX5B_002639 [Scophthalmus maximus]